MSEAATHSGYALVRRQCPNRTRLANQLRYGLARHPAISMDINAEGTWQCQVTGIRPLARPGDTRALVDDPSRFAADRQLDVTAPLTALVPDLLAACDQPIAFEHLVDAVAVLKGITDSPLPADVESDGPDHDDDGARHRHVTLEEVWSEVIALPVRQRAALLLSLTDPVEGLSRADVARAFEITDAQLDALWRELPLDSLAIAGRLGVTPQQVLNLQQSGRTRLSRMLPVNVRGAARRLWVALKERPDDFEHPSYDQLLAYAEEQLDAADREWVESHMACCTECREDVTDLAQTRAELATMSFLAAGSSNVETRPTTIGRVVAAVVITAVSVAVTIWLSGGWQNDATTDSSQTTRIETDAPSTESRLTKDEAAAIERALATGWVVFPDNIRLLRGQVGAQPNNDQLDSSFEDGRWMPIAPTGTMVESPRPVFTWPPLPDATGYIVTVFDERLRQVAVSRLRGDTSWTPGRDLPRGRMLAWQVTARRADQEDVVTPSPPEPEARFVVLTPAEVADLEEFRSRLADEPLALALALARYGLFDAAEQALTMAANDPRYEAVQIRALLDNLASRGQ